MNAREDAETEYFTIMSFEDEQDPVPEEPSLYSPNNRASKPQPQEYENTLSTTKMSMIHRNNEPDSDSYYGQLEEIVERIPQGEGKEEEKGEGDRRSKEEYLMEKSRWISESQLSCFIDYQGKVVQTVCRLTSSELLFVNGGCRFSLAKITKMKVLYQHYQRCIWLTYEDQGKTELKFKIYLQHDSLDDIYLLFARIAVQKLSLLGYEIDYREGKEEVDRFVMSGELLKRSQFVGRWDLRKVVITDRIQSFKNEVCTFSISNIKQIWTRFDVHKDGLIIKLRHGLTKTELAIPLADYGNRFGSSNWLYRIYRLISANSI